MCMLDLKIGKPSLRQQSFPEENSLIRLGLVGQLSGEVLLNFEPQTALGVVSKMMMMPVNAIDAIGQSAISELGNMVAGYAFINKTAWRGATPTRQRFFSYFFGRRLRTGVFGARFQTKRARSVSSRRSWLRAAVMWRSTVLTLRLSRSAISLLESSS